MYDLSSALNQPIIVGALDTSSGGASTNALYVLTPGRSIAGTYSKQHLLPFGEYAPGLGNLWHTTAKLVPGAKPELLTISLSDNHNLSLGPSICYEAVLPGLFTDMVRSGAELLINATDDSWLGAGNAPLQHLQGTVFRAIETRRTLVRASNSGVSAVIDASGRIAQRTRLSEATTLTAGILPRSGITTYVLMGDWFAYLCVMMASFGGLEQRRKGAM